MHIIDISSDIFRTEIYKDDPSPVLERQFDVEKRDAYTLSTLFMGLHTGTHVDAPSHYFEEGKKVNDLPLAMFIGECRVLEVPKQLITGADVDRYFPLKCPKRLLLKTNGQGGFDVSGAQELARRGVELIGIDSLSIAHHEDEEGGHKAFLRHDIAILENLQLEEVKQGDYFLIALPLKLDGVEASPVRAVLITDHIFWSGRR